MVFFFDVTIYVFYVAIVSMMLLQFYFSYFRIVHINQCSLVVLESLVYDYGHVLLSITPVQFFESHCAKLFHTVTKPSIMLPPRYQSVHFEVLDVCVFIFIVLKRNKCIFTNLFCRNFKVCNA